MAIPHLRELLVASATLLSLIGIGCNSNQEDVCENVGACTQAGDTDWITSCNDETKSLRNEATTDGCVGLFDDYYGCAASNFVCKGITASFPGCDGQRTALANCLSAGEAKSSCKELTARTSACAASSADGGAPEAGAVGLAPACTVTRDCQARCYLDHVKNPCAPAVEELSRITACSSSCPQ